MKFDALYKYVVENVLEDNSEEIQDAANDLDQTEPVVSEPIAPENLKTKAEKIKAIIKAKQEEIAQAKRELEAEIDTAEQDGLADDEADLSTDEFNHPELEDTEDQGLDSNELPMDIQNRLNDRSMR